MSNRIFLRMFIIISFCIHYDAYATRDLVAAITPVFFDGTDFYGFFTLDTPTAFGLPPSIIPFGITPQERIALEKKFPGAKTPQLLIEKLKEQTGGLYNLGAVPSTSIDARGMTGWWILLVNSQIPPATLARTTGQSVDQFHWIKIDREKEGIFDTEVDRRYRQQFNDEARFKKIKDFLIAHIGAIPPAAPIPPQPAPSQPLYPQLPPVAVVTQAPSPAPRQPLPQQPQPIPQIPVMSQMSDLLQNVLQLHTLLDTVARLMP